MKTNLVGHIARPHHQKKSYPTASAETGELFTSFCTKNLFFLTLSVEKNGYSTFIKLCASIYIGSDFSLGNIFITWLICDTIFSRNLCYLTLWRYWLQTYFWKVLKNYHEKLYIFLIWEGRTFLSLFWLVNLDITAWKVSKYGPEKNFVFGHFSRSAFRIFLLHY